jgi:HAD superfamily hydrolase (TIGR01549 family)
MTVLNRLRAILWDFDGTIVFFNFDAAGMRSEVFGFLQSNGYELPQDGVWRSVFQTVLDAKDFLLSQGNAPADVAALGRQVEEIINTYEVAGNDGARLVPGIVDVISEASTAGLKQAIITLNRSENVRTILERFQLMNYFETIAGRDNAPKLKPDPIHVQYLLELLEVQAGSCILIGDHPNDMETAQNAGVRFIAVTTDRHSAEEFGDGATYIVSQDHMEDLLPIIRELSS